MLILFWTFAERSKRIFDLQAIAFSVDMCVRDRACVFKEVCKNCICLHLQSIVLLVVKEKKQIINNQN